MSRDDVRWLSYGQYRPARHPGRLALCAGLLVAVFFTRPFEQGNWREVKKTGGTQLVEAGQLIQAVEAEMNEKAWSGHPQEWPATAGAPALGADPAGLHQCVDRTLTESHPADLLDFRARHRLVIGNDRKGFDCRPRQLGGHRPLDP